MVDRITNNFSDNTIKSKLNPLSSLFSYGYKTFQSTIKIILWQYALIMSRKHMATYFVPQYNTCCHLVANMVLHFWTESHVAAM